MRKLINKVVYIISILLIVIGVFVDIFMHLGNLGKLIFFFFPIILFLTNMLIQIKTSKDNKEKQQIRKNAFICMFILYVIILFDLLFLSNSYRAGNLFTWTRKYPLFSKENLSVNMNIIPLKNILEYIFKLLNHQINTKIVIVNILGNLIAFAPFGFFIQELFNDKIKNLKQFTICMIIGIFIIETIQFLTRVGSFDIDDLILNLTGAIAVYIICTLDSVKNVIYKILE